MAMADPLPRDVLPVVMAYSNPAGFNRRPLLNFCAAIQRPESSMKQ